jgi:hypothetical protein
MTEYKFTLNFDGGLTDDLVEALYKAGCGDMTLQGDPTGPGSADVHREAPSFIDAAVSAIDDIEKVPGLRVTEVEDQAFVGLGDIAWRLGRTPESVRLLTTGRRGPGGFPAPEIRRGRSRFWRWADVAEWANENLGTSFDPEESLRIAAVNAALTVRNRGRRLPAQERDALRGLAAAG